MVTLKLGSSLKALLGHVPYLPPRTRDPRAYEYFAAPRLTETVIQLLNAAEAAAHAAESVSR